MSPKPRNPAAFTGHFMRTRIIEASVPVFSEHGRDATVAQLLEAADVSRRTFYRYFKNKEEVLSGLYDVACGMLLTGIRASITQGRDPREKIQRGIDAYLDFHTLAESLVLFLQGEALRAGSPLADRRQATRQELEELLGREIQLQEGRRVDPLIYASVLWSLESLSLHVLRETDCTPKDIERTRRVMHAVVERVLFDDPKLPLPEATT